MTNGQSVRVWESRNKMLEMLDGLRKTVDRVEKHVRAYPNQTATEWLQICESAKLYPQLTGAARSAKSSLVKFITLLREAQ
jgi:hypothetical protein